MRFRLRSSIAIYLQALVHSAAESGGDDGSLQHVVALYWTSTKRSIWLLLLLLLLHIVSGHGSLV